MELKPLCDYILTAPEFKPGKGVTHCNQALNYVATAFGCVEFDGLMADDIYKSIKSNKSGKWTKADGSEATIWALSNGLSVAAMSSKTIGESHGHVAVVYPLGMQWSVSLGRDVPILANVGKSVGIMKSSEAFPVSKGEAEYFTYGG